MAAIKWKQEGSAWVACVPVPAKPNDRVVGTVRQDRETDSSATGWQAYYLGAQKVNIKGWPAGRNLEPVGYFRRLRDAMQHVMVLHKLED
jgi:hypothetical protein